LADQISDTRTINQLWTHAASYIEPGLQDEWTYGRPLLAFMNDERYAGAKVKKTIPGGPDIRPGVEFEEIPAYNFDGYDQTELQASDPFTQGVFQWRGIIVPIGVAATEIWKTNGQKRAVGGLVKNKMTNAMNSFRKRMSEELVQGNEGVNCKTAGNTVGSGKHIDGLRYALNYQNTVDDGYADWNRNANEWARHEIQDVGGAAYTLTNEIVSADPLLDYLDEYIDKCTCGMTGGEGSINLLLTTRTLMTYMRSRARKTPIPAHITVRNNLIDLGIKCQEYDGIPMFWDNELNSNLAGVVGTEAGQCVYGLNCRTLRLYVHEDADMKLSGLTKMQNQEVFRANLLWYGNLACLQPRHNFVLFGCDAPA